MDENGQKNECLRHLVAFVESGAVEEASSATGVLIAYLATLGDTDAQTTALDELQTGLSAQVERLGISAEAEDRHVAIEDAIEKARATLDSKGKAESPGK